MSQDDRRCYRREPLRLPLYVSLADKPADTFPARILDASPAGLLLKLPDGLDLASQTHLNLSLRFNDDQIYELGRGMIRRRAVRQGGQTLGIELEEKTLLLCGPPMVGVSPPILEIKSLLAQVCMSGLNVLIRGETGTGKNVLAKLIHDVCRGAQLPFIRVNCPSIPESLFESELFGHEKGAFTDAKASAPGYFRLAGEGTILLDEITEIRPHLQAKLLSVLEDKQFMPVGGSSLVPVRAAIIATTNRDLEKEVNAGRFRRDLFYRICEMPIHLPPLRERTEDLTLLANYFLLAFSEQFRRPLQKLSRSDLDLLRSYSWPGNVREMENYMKQTALMGRFVGPSAASTLASADGKVDGVLEAMGLPADLCDGQATLPEITNLLTTHIEQMLINKTLEMCGHNRTRAAGQLGISYRTLLRKLDQNKAALPLSVSATPQD
ncbi:sigma 54-interacting transcriptional regulator [Geoalkalibacter halelectricus]|uniref:Sigma 54-interacting transcriptional regulator n=1 Tax=Geoalkalibacter halelectricus TaxID=2847045 RepID=A0ABY5ZQN5_9BACT|nr:sigma 54-interacting transcriptional regulator [Geoalkalibacter halelectricus]MDO3378423.1 sigma 54-interacting transcriptional regulator [Geoalkalibacter halelectricus]UWZ80257.1 sigma 54-interacting transcriptional regulator [Geoalkalibacter halelectricus]